MIGYKDLTIKIRNILKYIDNNFEDIPELKNNYKFLSDFYSEFDLELDNIILDYKKQVND